MKKVPSNLYDKKYYLSVCLGSDEYKKSHGQSVNKTVKDLLKKIPVSKNCLMLDIGCGRGDISLFLARKTKKVIGIDYSKDAIRLANKARRNSPKIIQERTVFKQMDAEFMDFADNKFDIIISIDVFEHLTRSQLEKVMKNIKRILKPEGVLFVHTGTNKILYDFVYPIYIYPINLLLTSIDKAINSKKYLALPKDPRTKAEKEQHVNEPTFFYLKSLFQKYNFKGNIETDVGYLKKTNSLKGRIYNLMVCWYPFSKSYPLNILFGWAFICTVKNCKPLSKNLSMFRS